MKYLTPEVEDLYNELNAIKDTDVLVQKLDSFMKTKFNLQYLWLLRKFFRLIKDINLKNYPSLLAGMSLIYSMEGNITKSKECIKKIKPDSEERLFAEISLPGTEDEKFYEMVNKIKKLNIKSRPFNTLTAGRPSVINGFRDFSHLFNDDCLKANKEKLIKIISLFYDDEEAECVYRIALAEKYYQQDNLYQALIEIVNVIPEIRKRKNANLLFVALFVEIEILLISGQIEFTAIKMEEIKNEICDYGHDEYIPNLMAASAWSAMFDGRTEYVDLWMKNYAPGDKDEFCMLNLFQYMIKMRIYYMQDKDFALLSLSANLVPALIEGKREMDLCEVYMMIALSAFSNNDKKNAFKNLEKAISVAEKNGYYRLLADEGESIYGLLKEYCRKKGETPFIKKVMDMAEKVAERYPKYLDNKKTEKISFTSKEKEIFKLLKTKLSNAEMAEKMNISIPTVKFHLKNIYNKLGVNSRDAAVLKAKEEGYII